MNLAAHIHGPFRRSAAEKPMRAAIQKQLKELELMPQKLLAQVFAA